MTSSHHPGRRHFLRGLTAIGACALMPRLRAAPAFERNPYTLGVAAGYPRPDGVALWTRLAPDPQVDGGGLPPADIPVTWEIAEDAAFARPVARGEALAEAAYAHSVHVDVNGLAPGREYLYRFHAGTATSPLGRFRTAPALAADADTLRFAIASCQQYEQGYYAAYRHMADDALDLVVHVGDYIYESSWGQHLVRRHESPEEPRTLAAYRARYACYKSDPHLQRAHAACAWLFTFDDHEVENDYANARSQTLEAPARFLERRAAAYQAYWEHLPLPRAMRPQGPALPLHTRVAWGRLAAFHVLDTRQFRTAQPCPKPGRGGGNAIRDCAERENPAASMLGPAQEGWLAEGLGASKARWNLLVQTTRMAAADTLDGPGEILYSDSWDGYPAARTRLLDALVATHARNPLVFGGDVHAFFVNDLKRDFTRAEEAIVASEFVTTSISSQPPPEEWMETAVREGPHIHVGTGRHRGYLRMEIEAREATADLRTLADVRNADSACSSLSRWVVQDGRPGAVPA